MFYKENYEEDEHKEPDINKNNEDLICPEAIFGE